MKIIAARFVVTAVAALAGCAQPEPWYRTTRAAKRYEGHITVGAPFMVFTPLNATASFPLESLPPPVVDRYLASAPHYPDHGSESGYSASVFVEVVAREIDDSNPYAPMPTKTFRILRVERVGSPTKEFIASRASS